MTERRKILFISAPIGSGHVQAARALGEAMERQGFAEPVYVNLFDFIPLGIGPLFVKVYLRVLEWIPALYAVAYGWGNRSKSAVWGRDLLSRLLAGRMKEYLLRQQPAAIVCTHPTPAGVVASLASRVDGIPPIFGVITDFVVHRFWVYSEITGYFVASEELIPLLREQGLQDMAVSATGIPVRSDFARSFDRERVLALFGFSPEVDTILIMGGGEGVLPLEEICRVCDTIDEPLQVICVCGRNETARKNILRFIPDMRSCRIAALGFVDNVAELMAASDLLITKPGGMTCAETLASGLPMFLFRPIPGQEEANARFLSARGAALTAGTTAELRELLIRRNEVLAGMRAASKECGRPWAADAIGLQIMEMIGKDA